MPALREVNGLHKQHVIQPCERDYDLCLHNADWPLGVEDWTTVRRDGASFLHRTVEADGQKPLWEAILRFPSAPIYGTNRKHDYQWELDRINYHTLRLLRRKDPGADPSQVKRIYLLHNGLNETDDVGFYYHLADLLIEDDDSACILRPLPGHLGRYPFVRDFSEKPLDRYLRDAGDLFRQYLRFMLESQWLLSILVPQSSYRVARGLDLLAEGNTNTPGRADNKLMAESLLADWNRTIKDVPEELRGPAIDKRSLQSVVDSLRSLIGWQPSLDIETPPTKGETLDAPAVHTLGYSLGGFMAQSVFFTWPFAIASCATICAGGALREVAPIVFAHPEEWQTVMHALRFELHTALMEQRIKVTEDTVAGLSTKTYSYFERMFHEVFLQDFRGSYRSRVSEYVSRLFFVVGGNDPIVRPESVLRASPPGGINLLEVANLSHFVSQKTTPHEEELEWWLPQVTDLVGQIAVRSERSLARSLNDTWMNMERTTFCTGSDPIKGTDRGETRHEDIALSDSAFAKELRQISERNGWIFIFRNVLPVVLLDMRMLHRRGIALHHSDLRIKIFLLNVRKLRSNLVDRAGHLTVLIPDRAREWFLEEPALISPRWETAPGLEIDRAELRRVWDDFIAFWSEKHNSVGFFKPQDLGTATPEFEGPVRTLLKVGSEVERIINTLPDVWIGFSGSARDAIRGHTRSPGNPRQAFEKAFCEWASELADKINSKDRASTVRSNIRKWIAGDDLMIVKLSAAGFNPRFRGWRIRDYYAAERILVHCALAWTRSTPPNEGR